LSLEVKEKPQIPFAESNSALVTVAKNKGKTKKAPANKSATFPPVIQNDADSNNSNKTAKTLLVLGVLLTIFIIFLNFTNNFSSSNSPAATIIPSTPTRRPVSTPTIPRTPTLQIQPLSPNCFWWFYMPENSLGTEMCIQGIVNDIKGNSESDGTTQIFFTRIPKGYSGSAGEQTSFYVVDYTYFYPDMEIGDCVIATGLVRINKDGIYFINSNGNIERCY
jgi:hypothetical protein